MKRMIEFLEKINKFLDLVLLLLSLAVLLGFMTIGYRELLQ